MTDRNGPASCTDKCGTLCHFNNNGVWVHIEIERSWPEILNEDVVTLDILLHTILMIGVGLAIGLLAQVHWIVASWFGACVGLWLYEMGQFMIGRDKGFAQSITLGGEIHKVFEVLWPAIFSGVIVAVYLWVTL